MQQTRQAADGGKCTRATVEMSETGLATAAMATTGRIETQAAEGGRERVEAVVETLAHLHGEGDSLAAVAHDARNMVTALELYCDLLEEPGVLTPAFNHYASELKLVATSSHRLVEKLLALDLRLGPIADLSRPVGVGWPAARDAVRQDQARGWDLMPSGLIDNLAGEVLASRNLLAALAGPAIALTVDAVGGAQPVRMSGEDLTRILVNLVRNAAEAMPGGGRIQIGLCEDSAATGASRSLTLTVEDNGRGIPGNALEKIFESGYTTSITENGLPASHHGLGLAITRSIVEAAGGSIQAFRREPAGARFEIELPIRSR